MQIKFVWVPEEIFHFHIFHSLFTMPLRDISTKDIQNRNRVFQSGYFCEKADVEFIQRWRLCWYIKTNKTPCKYMVIIFKA